jgi:hypothetical protein
MASLDDYGDTQRVESLLDAVANLHCEALLNLKTASKTLNDTSYLRQTCDISIGDVGYVGLANKWQHVMLTYREKLNILNKYHLLILLFEYRRAENLNRILGVALGDERHSLGYALRGLDKTLTVGILAK